MQLAVSKLKAPTNRSTFTLWHLTDLHIDDGDHAADELDRDIQAIADDPYAIWLFGGDGASLILPSDKRYATHPGEDVHRIPDWYVHTLTEKLAPIAGKCVGFGDGNHERTIHARFHRGVGAEIAHRLGIPHLYLGSRGWSVMQFAYAERRIITVKAYWFHGWSAGRLKGRKALQAQRDLGAWDADIFLLGHDHQPYADVWYTQDAVPTKNGWTLKSRPRAVLNGGSYTYGQSPPCDITKLKPHEIPGPSWVEGRNFPPQPPVHPLLLMHLDFGNGVGPRGQQGRPSSIAFETRMHAPSFYTGQAA